MAKRPKSITGISKELFARRIVNAQLKVYREKGELIPGLKPDKRRLTAMVLHSMNNPPVQPRLVTPADEVTSDGSVAQPVEH